jgi:hypothetical protein
MLFKSLSVGALFLGGSLAAPHKDSALVDLGYAQYQGVPLEAGVNQFLGMRYAAAPLGDLRFRAPEDPPSSGQVQNAFAVCQSSNPPLH